MSQDSVHSHMWQHSCLCRNIKAGLGATLHSHLWLTIIFVVPAAIDDQPDRVTQQPRCAYELSALQAILGIQRSLATAFKAKPPAAASKHTGSG